MHRATGGFETRAIHAGQEPDPATGAVVAADQPVDHVRPAGRSATTGAGSTRAAATRPAPRSRRAWPRSRAPATASPSPRGWPPRTPCCASCRPAARRRARRRRLRRHVPAHRQGLRRRRPPVDGGRPDRPGARSAASWPDGTAMVWAETPTNPAHGDRRHRGGGRGRPRSTARWLVVDNTFATPVPAAAAGARRRRGRPLGHQVPRRPLRRGRRLRGARRRRPRRAASASSQNAVGAVPSPFDCYLVQRGVKTLAVRMDRHCDNARAVVELLAEPPGRRARAVAGPARPPRPRRGQAADARLRRHGVVRGPRRRGARRCALCRAHRAVHAGRVAGGGRVADRAPGPDDPRVGRRLARWPSTRRWCACRSASRRPPTWWPTSARRSTASDLTRGRADRCGRPATAPGTLPPRWRCCATCPRARVPRRARRSPSAPTTASTSGHRAVIAEVRRRAAERGLRHRGRHVRPAPGLGRAARVGAPPAHRPRPEARAAGRDRHRLLPGRSRSTRPAARSRPRTSSARCWPTASTPGSWWWARTSTSATSGRATSPCCAELGAELGFEVEGLDLVGADGRPAGDDATGCRRPASATRWPRATWRWPTRCSGGPTRCGASWPTATSGAASWGSPRPTCRCPATSCCRPTASTPGGTSGPTARSTRPPSRSGGGPTFYAEAHASLLEAHLLDFDGDLYDEHAKVRFVGLAARRGAVRLGRRAGRPDRPRLSTRPASSCAA